MAIKDFNTRVAVNQYVFGQDNSGGPIKALNETFDMWAQLQPLNGSKALDNLQVAYTKAYRMTVRYESTRLLHNTNEIVYENNVFVIQSIAVTEEGRKRFNELIIYTSGDISNNADLTQDIILKVARVEHFFGTGTEFEIISDKIAGWSLIIVFRDGVNFSVVSSTPVGKEVKYVPVTIADPLIGSLTFSSSLPPLALNEKVDVYLIK